MPAIKLTGLRESLLIQPQNRPHGVSSKFQRKLHNVDRFFSLRLETCGALNWCILQVDSNSDLEIKFTAFVRSSHQTATHLQVSDKNIVDPLTVYQFFSLALILKVSFNGLNHSIRDEHREIPAASEIFFDEQSEIHIAGGTDPPVGVLSASFALRLSREGKTAFRGEQFSGPFLREKHGGGYVVEIEQDQFVAVERQDCHQGDLLVVVDFLKKIGVQSLFVFFENAATDGIIVPLTLHPTNYLLQEHPRYYLSKQYPHLSKLSSISMEFSVLDGVGILGLQLQLIVMKANTAFVANKKLILHFDVQQVLALPNDIDKDLFVYELCSNWLWGRLEKTSKENPDLVTGWKIASNALALESPEPDLISYKSYVDQYVKPSKEEYAKLMQNVTKGPGAKAKSEFEKSIKNITLPKTLAEAIKEGADPSNKLLAYFNRTGKYQILPAFFKLLLNLKKNKREFAVIIKNSVARDQHQEIISELNLFFSGEHPLFNGKNGTPAVKWDGSKGNRNFIVQDTHQAVYYTLGDGQLFATYGTLSLAQEKDIEMFKQKFKSLKAVKLCEKPEEIFAVGHALLAESACIYQINPLHTLVIDPVDYLTHQIYFTSAPEVRLFSCLNEQITDKRSFVVKVHLFDYLRDVDYFIKQVEVLEGQRGAEITRIEKKEGEQTEEVQQAPQEQLSNYEYLKKNLLPVLEGALKQVDLLRPQDPLGFIALYCLKNRDRLQ